MVTEAPDPRTWAVGERVTAARLNELRATLEFLLSPPSCSLRASGAQNVSTGSTWALASFDTEDWDWLPDPMHDTSTNPSRLYFPVSGLYQVNLGVRFAQPNTTPTGYREANLRVNSDGSSSGGTSHKVCSVGVSLDGTQDTDLFFSDAMVRTAGDYVEVFMRHTQGSTLGCLPYLDATFIST